MMPNPEQHKDPFSMQHLLARLPRTLIGALALAALLSAAVPTARAADGTMTPAQRKAVENVVRDYLRQNPEVLVEAIRALRAKEEARQAAEQEAAIAHLAKELHEDPLSPVTGNPDGDVTVVEFFDYRCGYCKQIFPEVQKLLKDDGKIRYVFKEFPILGPESVVAARVATAAWITDPDKYMLLHTTLMALRGGLTEAKLVQAATDVGYDADALRAAMKDDRVQQSLARNMALAQALGVRSTPTFVVGTTVISGARPDALLEAVAAARGG